METILLATGLIPVIILVVIGIAIKYFKAYWLISGYNTMSKEKKKNVDTEGLGKLVGNVCFVIAGIVLAAFIPMLFGKMAIAGIIFALIIPTVIYTLIKAQKYDGNTKNAEGKMKTKTKVTIGLIIAVLLLATVGIGVLLYSSNKPVEYSLENGILKISGMYGEEVPVKEVSSVELKDTIPQVLSRTNGSALGDMLKGHFKLKDIGAAKLFTDTSKPPFIYLKRDSKIIILNCEESAKTKELYNSIYNEWQKLVK